jgi:hypothetical protein
MEFTFMTSMASLMEVFSVIEMGSGIMSALIFMEKSPCTLASWDLGKGHFHNCNKNLSKIPPSPLNKGARGIQRIKPM